MSATHVWRVSCVSARPVQGVSCDPTNSVALQLSLSDSLLQGFIPDLSVFANLTSLSLQNNMLNGQLPDTLGRLSALQVSMPPSPSPPRLGESREHQKPQHTLLE